MQLNSRCYHRDHPEWGYGTIKYVEEDEFDEGSPEYQVQFDHLDDLKKIPPAKLAPAILLEEGTVCEGNDLGSLDQLRSKLGAGLVISENHLTGAFLRTSTRPLPHQAFLLDKILTGARFGHLIADDVGLGKTIEAGLIINSLLQGESASRKRILILCPAGLSAQWQDELEEHFGLYFSVLGTNFIAKQAKDWTNQYHVIASVDTLKNERYRTHLAEAAPFDLVVCDEAHRLTAKRAFLSGDLERSQSFRFVEWLVRSRVIDYELGNDRAPRSPRLLLLSATPHQGDDLRFAYLLQLVRPDLLQLDEAREAPELDAKLLQECVTRTAKSRAIDWDGKPLFKGRESKTIPLSWSEEEVEASAMLTRYIQTALTVDCDEQARSLVIELVMHSFHKLAASSWPALGNALNRRLARVRGTAEAGALESEDGIGEEEINQSGLEGFFSEEESVLGGLITKIDSLPRDTKLEEFMAILAKIEEEQPGAKVLVFTQYRTTQSVLIETIQARFPDRDIEEINGTMDSGARSAARRAFEEKACYMISTEAGGEGINLHRSCRHLINYDLPWNPMRLQQRIGRLDRFGQKHRVLVFNLQVAESWDRRIMEKIEEKLDTVQESMGQVTDGDDYHQMILGTAVDGLDGPALFAMAVRKGEAAVDAEIEKKVREAQESRRRWEQIFSENLGLQGSPEDFKPDLDSSHLEDAFRWAAEGRGIHLGQARTEDHKNLRGVFNFEIPDTFKKGVGQPKRAYIVFDKERFSEVRNKALGKARGQDIRPSIVGFGDRITDWLFESAFQANASTNVFRLIADSASWEHGEGQLWFYGLRWKGSRRPMNTPDSIAGVFQNGSECELVERADLFSLLRAARDAPQANVALSRDSTQKALVVSTIRQQASRLTNADSVRKGIFVLGVADIVLAE